MVFFAVATVICSVMVSSAVQRGDELAGDLLSSSDPDALLSVYLGASVGEQMLVEEADLELTGLETFGEVLSVLGWMALDGRPIGAFEPVLAVCGEVILRLCQPWSPFLSLYCDEGDGWQALISIGIEPGERSDAVSAVQNLGGRADASLIATLVLLPPLLPHGGDV
jgi:hypothetical protein